MFRISILTIALALGSCDAGAKPQPDKGSSNATNFNYDVQTSLTYIDKADRARTTSSFYPDTAKNLRGAVLTPRALGLSQARLEMAWDTPSAPNFRMVIRPDALQNRSETATEDSAASVDPAREFDYRAGKVYRPMPTVRFLDSYVLSLDSYDQVDVGIGVYERIAVRIDAYKPILAFGLRVRLPAKYAGLHVSWHSAGGTASVAAEDSSGIGAEIIAFQGDEDRVEDWAESSSSFDTAPVAADPYHGGAVHVNWLLAPQYDLGLLVGSSDNAVLGGGRRNELFLQAYAVANFYSWIIDSKVSFDFRYAKEKWRVDDLNIAPKVQQSALLMAASRLTTRSWLLTGVAIGRSEDALADLDLDRINPVSGHHIEAGYYGILGENLGVQIMLSVEQREMEDENGDTVGAFLSGDERENKIRRMAVELNYVLNQNS